MSQIQTWVRSEDNKFTPPAEFNFTHWDEGDAEADERDAERGDSPGSSPLWQAVRPGPLLVRKGISPAAVRFMRGIMDECTHLKAPSLDDVRKLSRNLDPPMSAPPPCTLTSKSYNLNN